MNWFLNLLVRDVIEREIKKEKVQMKPPNEFCLFYGSNEETIICFCDLLAIIFSVKHSMKIITDLFHQKIDESDINN